MNPQSYLRNRRGVASIESTLGAVAMIAASLLALDLYRLATTQTTSMYAAVSLADSLSREEPEGVNVRQAMDTLAKSLAEFLHKEQFPTSDVVFVVSAMYKSPDSPEADPPSVVWTREEVRYSTEDLSNLTRCRSENQENEIKISADPATLPEVFTMADHGLEEVVIVAEVCVERTSTALPGAVYAHYIVPSRDDNLVTRLGAS